MKKTFKYKVNKKSCSRDFERNSLDEERYLKKNGDDGWELVSVVPYDPSTNVDSTTYYWKKEIYNV